VSESPDPLVAGERLFARYAHAPNALGYCGPAAAAVLQRSACGLPTEADAVRRVARQFSGVWPYQVLMAGLLGRDPLSEEVGRAYWTGSDLTDEVDDRRLGDLLIERFAAQAGHYWSHLGPELFPEVRPTHAFHVLGVYPWTRLLASGRPEPVLVLDSCRIRAGRVLDVDQDSLLVEVDALVHDGRLWIGEPSQERVARRTPDGVMAEFTSGDWAAIHWSFACDRLSPAQAETLLARTAEQVSLTNARLTREEGS
jgi:hypothetical protein